MSTTVTGSTIALPSLTEEDIQRELQLRDGLAGGAHWGRAYWRAGSDAGILRALAEQGMRIARGRARTEAG